MSNEQTEHQVTTTKPMALTIVNPQAVQRMDVVAREFGVAMTNSDSPFTNTFLTAQAIGALEEAITPDMMKCIMHLQDSQLGFKTDRANSNGYPEPVVKRCIIDATLRGVTPVGNQFNIISGTAYITKEGFGFLLKKIPGMTDFKLSFSVPDMKQSGAIVHFSASWQMNGIKDTMEGDIPIRINSGMGADAVLGKAERKAKCRIYNRITGSELTDGDAGDAAQLARNITSEVLYPTADDARNEQLEAALAAARTAGVPEPIVMGLEATEDVNSVQVYELIRKHKAAKEAEARREQEQADTITMTDEPAKKPEPAPVAAKKRESTKSTLQEVAAKMGQSQLAEQVKAYAADMSAVMLAAYGKMIGVQIEKTTDFAAMDTDMLRTLHVAIMVEVNAAKKNGNISFA